MKNSHRKPVIALLTLLTITLAGCSLAPRHERPDVPVPAQWAVPDQAISSPAMMDDWRNFIVDDDLRALVRLALDNNRDLRITLANIEAARAQYGVQRSLRFPSISAQASGSRQGIPADVSQTGDAVTRSQYQVGLGLTAFELDFFGRVENLSEAALQEYLATAQAERSLRISLVGEISQAYLQRSSALQRNVLSRDTLASRERSLALTRLRADQGASSDLDYQEAVGLVEQARAEAERTDREARLAANALALLTGMADMAATATPGGEHKDLFQALSPGLPSRLLERRPDIQAAEHRLRSRHASIGAARAAFFPSITLTGNLGTASTELSGLFGAGSRSWQFLPQLNLPIFSGGREQANLDLASARRDGAIAEYEKTIQVAFTEVADALASRDTLMREEAARSALAASSLEALRLSGLRYQRGVDSHLRYLDAERRSFADRLALIEIRTQRQIIQANLYKALAGGWSPQAPEVATAR